MGLVLTLKEGEDFFVSDSRYAIERIDGARAVSVSRASDGRIFDLIEDGRPVEIAHDVRARVGLRGQSGLARLDIDAPRQIPIDRGDNYRAVGGHRPRRGSGEPG